MSYTSGFFDAIDQGGGDYDRVYSAETFAHYFSLLVKNGVFPDPSTGLQVRASSNPDMKVSVSPGSGWINGYYITVPDNSPEVLTVPTANPSLSRYDSVIMGLNFVDREIQLYIKSGAVSASPSAVTLKRDSDLYELELARILVGAGTASITQSMITDTRSDSTRCGIVTGMIDQIDTTNLFAQYDAAFNEWFKAIKTQLEGDVATNIINKLNELSIKVDENFENSLSTETKTMFGLSADAVPDDAFVSLLNYSLHGLYRYDLTIIIDGMPLANVEVSGLTAVDGSAVYTDENGKVIGFAGDSTTITFPKYADLTEFSFGVAKENMVTTKTLTGQRTIEVLTLSTSKIYQFSSHVDKVSICTVGGGGNGAGAWFSYGGSGTADMIKHGGGGGGGFVASLLHISPIINADYIFTVGAQSGTSSCTVNNEVILEAAGGANADQNSGGSGNGNGGNGYVRFYSVSYSSSGSAGTGYIFDDESYGAVGGGGGGGQGNNQGDYAGGSPNGGNGGSSTTYNGSNALGYGGGGGGGTRVRDHNYGGGFGYQGAVLIRFDRFKGAK